MGKIIASCGHELMPIEGFGKQIAVEGWTRDCKPAVDYITVCNKCYSWYKRKKYILSKSQINKVTKLEASKPQVSIIPCPNCYGGHFRPCQWCGDTGRINTQ